MKNSLFTENDLEDSHEDEGFEDDQNLDDHAGDADENGK